MTSSTVANLNCVKEHQTLNGYYGTVHLISYASLVLTAHKGAQVKDFWGNTGEKIHIKILHLIKARGCKNAIS